MFPWQTYVALTWQHVNDVTLKKRRVIQDKEEVHDGEWVIKWINLRDVIFERSPITRAGTVSYKPENNPLPIKLLSGLI